MLLVVNNDPLHKYSLPSKIFEYLPTGNPILAYGLKHPTVNKILKLSPPSKYFENANKDLYNWLKKQYVNWKNDKLCCYDIDCSIYDRRNLTKNLVEVIKSNMI